jgi:hypothetical protein
VGEGDKKLEWTRVVGMKEIFKGRWVLKNRI